MVVFIQILESNYMLSVSEEYLGKCWFSSLGEQATHAAWPQKQWIGFKS